MHKGFRTSASDMRLRTLFFLLCLRNPEHARTTQNTNGGISISHMMSGFGRGVANSIRLNRRPQMNDATTSQAIPFRGCRAKDVWTLGLNGRPHSGQEIAFNPSNG